MASRLSRRLTEPGENLTRESGQAVIDIHAIEAQVQRRDVLLDQSSPSLSGNPDYWGFVRLARVMTQP